MLEKHMILFMMVLLNNEIKFELKQLDQWEVKKASKQATLLTKE